MAPNDIFTAGIVLLGFFAIHFLLSVPFASYQAHKLVREQWPDQWAARHGVSGYFWIASLVFGWAKLNVAGNVHARRLSLARIIVHFSVIDLLMGLGMIGWALAQ
jgi:hypothetical protein